MVVPADAIEPEFLAKDAAKPAAIEGVELIENPVDEKFREMVPLRIEPYEGSFKVVNDHVYICTGTGKSWYCHDNSAGDTSLEGGYVCYAYYVLANDEQISEYNEQKRAKTQARAAYKRLNEIERYMREHGEPVRESNGTLLKDTRTYNSGVGYAPGVVWKEDGDTLYMSYYSASDVAEWQWSRYRLDNAAALIEEVKNL